MKETNAKKAKKGNVPRVIGLALCLFILWLILSGNFELKFIVMAIIFSLFVAIVSVPVLTVSNRNNGKDYYLFKMNWVKFVGYAAWMLTQIISAAWDVTKATLNQKLVEPSVVYFKMPFENPVASSLLSNSIIITPGTITLDVDDDGVFTVHALTKNAADGLLSGTMQKKVAELYGENCEYTPYPEKTLYDIPKEED